VKIFNWIATLWQGTIEFKTPLLFAVGVPHGLPMGGITGVILAIFPSTGSCTTRTSSSRTSTTCSSAARSSRSSRDLLLVPEDDRPDDERGPRQALVAVMFVGFNLAFAIQHTIGLEGMPRRVYEYPDIGNMELYNLISTIGSFIFALGILITIINIADVAQARQDRRPGPVEGQHARVAHPSPPPVNNFDTVPRVRSVEPMKDIRRQVERQTAPVASRDEVAPEHSVVGG
jgi:cytochrome c oxidase subunit 1